MSGIRRTVWPATIGVIPSVLAVPDLQARHPGTAAGGDEPVEEREVSP